MPETKSQWDRGGGHSGTRSAALGVEVEVGEEVLGEWT